ncbi:MAG: [Fe-Fe] hydrogenase large subunit C-terminal domain-containing protein [Bacillota bacterium]
MVIINNEAKCRDCYRCLRSCPVQAIGFSLGSGETEMLHAHVISERCIMDGRCVLVCPQKAKRARQDLAVVKELLLSGVPVAASVAPSFAAAIPALSPGQVLGFLKKLGFARVLPTAIGAELVADYCRRHVRSNNRPVITSSCPVVVSMVEKYHPHAIPYLVPVVSPMTAHARLIKKMHPEMQVVFIGPCIGKKAEGDEVKELKAVLTFKELWDWWQEEGDGLGDVAEAEFDGPQPSLSQLFPLEGGFLITAGLTTDMLAGDTLVVSGVEECLEFLSQIGCGGYPGVQVVEMMACRGGCINGPKVIGEDDLFSRRNRLLQYYHAKKARIRADLGKEPVPALADSDLHRSYINRKIQEVLPEEPVLREILARTGKHRPEDELNCGACGYNSCRDKALAVYQGRAELDMCIPFMRQKAESFSNLVLGALSSGVLVVDNKLRVLEANAAAQAMFGSNCQIVGEEISRLFEGSHLTEVLNLKSAVKVVVPCPQFQILTRQTVFYLNDHDLIVCIIDDITQEEARREKVQQMKKTTIDRAQEVITKQMKVAQEIAGLLGETTAETKVLLQKLIDLMKEE